jgi:hypothetical protein
LTRNRREDDAIVLETALDEFVEGHASRNDILNGIVLWFGCGVVYDAFVDLMYEAGLYGRIIAQWNREV